MWMSSSFTALCVFKEYAVVTYFISLFVLPEFLNTLQTTAIHFQFSKVMLLNFNV